MFDTQIRIGSRMLNCIHIVMWWWLSWGSDCHVVVIVMWWWFSCKIKPGNGDRCWLYRACWWLSCGGGCHVVVIVIGSGCHVVVMVIGNDCTGSGWLLTLPFLSRVEASVRWLQHLVFELWVAALSCHQKQRSWQDFSEIDHSTPTTAIPNYLNSQI